MDMAEINSYTKEEKAQGLKSADSKKTVKDAYAGAGLRSEILGRKKITEKAIGSNVKVKKRLPIVVDVIVGILMLVLVCAVIISSYLLFRYFSNDYEGANVEYKVAFTVTDGIDTYEELVNKELFMDVTGNSVYFGKITAVETVADPEGNGGKVIFTVKASVKHRDGEGYSIGDSRLAVGSKYDTLRSGEVILKDLLVTDLAVEGN